MKNIEHLIRLSKLPYRVFLLDTTLKDRAEVYSSGYFYNPLIFTACKVWLRQWEGLEDSETAKAAWRTNDCLMSIEWSNRMYDSIQQKVRDYEEERQQES